MVSAACLNHFLAFDREGFGHLGLLAEVERRRVCGLGLGKLYGKPQVGEEPDELRTAYDGRDRNHLDAAPLAEYRIDL